MPTCVGKARLVKKAIGAGLKCGGGSGVVSVAVWVFLFVWGGTLGGEDGGPEEGEEG